MSVDSFDLRQCFFQQHAVYMIHRVHCNSLNCLRISLTCIFYSYFCPSQSWQRRRCEERGIVETYFNKSNVIRGRVTSWWRQHSWIISLCTWGCSAGWLLCLYFQIHNTECEILFNDFYNTLTINDVTVCMHTHNTALCSLQSSQAVWMLFYGSLIIEMST